MPYDEPIDFLKHKNNFVREMWTDHTIILLLETSVIKQSDL